MLACSGTLLEDSIQYCPKHTGPFKKETIAACETCGQALCAKHVFNVQLVANGYVKKKEHFARVVEGYFVTIKFLCFVEFAASLCAQIVN